MQHESEFRCHFFNILNLDVPRLLLSTFHVNKSPQFTFKFVYYSTTPSKYTQDLHTVLWYIGRKVMLALLAQSLLIFMLIQWSIIFSMSDNCPTDNDS